MIVRVCHAVSETLCELLTAGASQHDMSASPAPAPPAAAASTP
jgi:hypothetical protein